MIGFRENEEKNCNFPPPPQKVGKGAPISTNFFSRALRGYSSLNIPNFRKCVYF